MVFFYFGCRHSELKVCNEHIWKLCIPVWITPFQSYSDLMFQLLPGVRQDEFRERRFRLMEGIHKHASKHDNSLKQHLVVIPSATKVYMTEKIPYVFRQNTDFLYLSGCLEPDSALVLTGMRGDDHVSTLFVRKRDKHSELWDGPRTGVEGSPALFGVDQAFALTDLESFIASFTRSHRNFILWYDFMNPLQPDVHRILREFLGDTWNKVCAFTSAVLYFKTWASLLTETITNLQLGIVLVIY
jgi:hypothetical protein